MDPEPLGLESIADFEASLLPDELLQEERSGSARSAPVPTPASPDAQTHAAPPPAATPRAATPKRQSPEAWVGRRLSHFRLMRLIGSGNMGVVFQVEDVNLKRIAALKVLRRQIKGVQRATLVERFLLEARTAAAIDHPSIAQVYEIDEHSGWWYIAMEFLEGGSLDRLIKANGPLTPERAALVGADAARGLAAAHEEGVIHRDIKPANLMLTRRGRCKLVDFGLVKLDSAENPFRDDDRLVIGTPLYVAPEVAKGRGATTASDVYSLGATLYTLLTGTPPFRAPTIEEVLRMQVKAPVPDIRAQAPHCSATLAGLLMRALAKDPPERPTADAFGAALQAEVAGGAAADFAVTPVTPLAGSPPERSGPLAIENSPPTGQSSVAAAGGSSGARADLAGTVVLPVRSSPTVPQPVRRNWTWIIGLIAVLLLAGSASLYFRAQPRSIPPATPLSHETNSIGMQFVAIPAGSFVLGSPPAEEGRNQDERAVDVTLTREFCMSRTEVTQGQWAAVMGTDYVPPEGVHPNEESGRRFLGDALPAYVSWNEAAEFCRLLSEREGRCYRLPTEAEWEYACRAGTLTAFHTGPTLNPAQANIDAESNGEAPSAPRPRRHPLPVASFAPNPWGLYDMHGNVMEWCADWRAEYPLGPLTDPAGPETGKLRVLRGGSWDSPARVARSANRWYNPPVLRTDAIGFRVALEPSAPPPSRTETYLESRLSTAASPPATSAEAAPQGAALAVDPQLPDYVPEAIIDQHLRSVGSDTMDQLMGLWEQAFQQWHPQVAVRHEGRGSETAVPALAEGLSHLGPMSRPLRPAERRDFQSEYGYEPTQVCVAIDALAVYVHAANPIAQRGLSLPELDAIYSSTRKRGFLRDVRVWGDLGLADSWADAAIRAYSRNPASGTYSVFRQMVLDGGEFKSTNQELVSSSVVVQAVAGDPYAIGFSGIGFRQPGVLPVPLSASAESPRVAPLPEAAYAGSYPLARPLFLTIDHPPGEALAPLHREFLRFVYSRQGQELVATAGFFPLTAELARQELQRIDLALPPR